MALQGITGFLTLVLPVVFAATVASADAPDPGQRPDREVRPVQDAAVRRNERVTTPQSGFALLALPMAMPSDIDSNRDGRISFDELARHDLPNDF